MHFRTHPPRRRKHLPTPSLRGWLSVTIIAVLLVLASPLRAATEVATLDWTLAETLMALEVTPQGVAQVEAYHDWVGSPALPDSVADLGLRSQPNLELLASLDPDRILITPMFAALEPRLSRIAPVTSIGIYMTDGERWSGLVEATREVAALVDRPEAGERLIERTETALARVRRHLPASTSPLLLVQFMDARHVRVFGANSLYQAVLEHLGLVNAWQGTTNRWGFSLVGLEALATLDARLVVIEPLPVGVREQLDENGLWRSLRAVRQQRVTYLPPVWSFGALPSARRFAETLVAALTEERVASSGGLHGEGIADD
ncbi:iron complex transport system substrate-binding protein [Modicisalibacter ilicicola DSM 19980]|uniref:Iron complex transport system substrate-binding protein n=1 Tax=Modicisalibacter ilicicola DSM 19980 TaxID=1121942 RepID=A0A1M5CKS4_9GAMM|nr:ABC transporter substrate-binding protein [Halomonas ilicicola]SHF55385.1 iron complex transport system substrate-binding protein [Halomonas ilicicola DSM 19980]